MYKVVSDGKVEVACVVETGNQYGNLIDQKKKFNNKSLVKTWSEKRYSDQDVHGHEDGPCMRRKEKWNG